MLRTWYKPVFLFLGVLGSKAGDGTVGSLCFNESKATDFEKGIGAMSRENLLRNVRSRSDRSLLALFNKRSMQLGLRTGGCRT